MTARAPLKVAVLGAGYFARFQYEAWSRMGDVRLAAACDIDAAKAGEVAACYGIEQVFTDLETMLDGVMPDVLDVAVPPSAHFAAIEAAVGRGIAVICQKPFCGTLADAERATRLAADAGVPIIVHENFRFQPWHREAKRQLDAGLVGDLYQISFRMRPGDGQGPSAYLSRQPYFQTMRRFMVHETAIHFVDVFRYLMGVVTTVQADLRQLNPAIAGEDAGVFVLGFAGGQRAVFDGNRLIDHVADNHRLTMGDMLIEGSEGVLTLNGDGALHHRRKGERCERPIAFSWQNCGFAGDSVRFTQEAAIAALLGRQPAENSAAEYLVNLRIEEAIYASNETGLRLKLDGEGRLIDAHTKHAAHR